MVEPEDFIDIYNLELKLREKLNELHWKKESLEEVQKELSEVRRSFYETQVLLEDERRSSKQLEIQLKLALEAKKRLEEEKINNETQNVRIKMKYEAAEIERGVVVSQARIAKLENLQLKAKIQELEAKNENSKTSNEVLEKSLMELRKSAAKVHTNFHSSAEKLQRDQEQLKKSVSDSMEFTRRVLSNLKISHIARQRDKTLIEKLQKRVDELLAREIPSAAVQVTLEGDHTDIGTLHLKMESTLQELRKKLENNSIDDKLSLICSEFRKMDERLVKD